MSKQERPHDTAGVPTEPQNEATEKPRALYPTASVSMLKALANPIRQQLFHALTATGHARATDLAATLSMPANKVSFHLRVLADANLIEEAPEHARDKRDRVWKPTRGSWELGNPENPVEDEAAAGAVTNWVAADLHAMIQRLVAWAPEYHTGRTTEVHGTLALSNLWLTEDEFVALMEEIGTVMRAKEGRPQEQGRRRWQLGFIAADDQI